jgi:hypothetical protein
MSLKTSSLAIATVVFALVLAAPAAAATKGADGYFRTGDAVQTANHWPFTIELFAIWHDVSELPSEKSAKALVELDADKRFSMRMMRDLDTSRLRAGLRDGYTRNGFTDAARVDRLLAALTGTLAKDSVLWITYDAKTKETRLTTDKGASASVIGVDFMRATWSIWLGKAKPQELSASLSRDL